MTSHNVKHTSESGYVLVLTLVSLVVLSLGMAVAAEQLTNSQKRQMELREIREFRIKAYSLENELGYSLAKEYFLRQPDLGFEQSASVGRLSQTRQEYIQPYLKALKSNFTWNEELIGENIEISGLYGEVHNRQSMIDLNLKSDAFIRFVAEQLGAEQARNFVDTLFDYTDEDNFNRTRGGEQADYDDIGGTVANRPLMHLQEICAVLLWKDLQICQEPLNMARLFYTDNGSYIRLRVASEFMKKFVLEDRYVENSLGSQMSEWQGIAQSNGFFDLELLGGQSGPKYVVISKSGLETGIFRRVELRVMPIGSARPIQVLSQWETAFTTH